MKACVRGLFAALMLLLIAATPVSAQITTGTVSGTIKDAQGGVIPGATVVLVSEARGTKLAPVTTDETGTYVIPNVTADTYTIEISMGGFKTLRRQGVKVSGGDRVAVPAATLEVGGATETVNVSAEAALVQSQSAERSFAISTEQVENLPIQHSNFISLTQLTPGVQNGGNSAGATRIGGVGQNNIMMDGISAMDTGNNGQMLAMNIESIAEVKILTQGYQAEFGRSSGLQITAVTKSGTNRFRGSAYDLQGNSDWYTNSWVNAKNGDPKPKATSKTLGYSIGGPIGKPGGGNKLFFFYSHEYRPTNNPINGGNPIRLRVPTAAERAGDFSQTLDNNGALFNFIKDPTSPAGTCGVTNGVTVITGCFQDGGVLGKIPASSLYSVGLAALNRYPMPSQVQSVNTNYNLQIDPPKVKQTVQQPALRLDYQMSSKLRVTGKYSGQRQAPLTTIGLIPGMTDVLSPYPFITNYAVTANYTVNPTTFLEGTYGFIRNELTGGNENGVLTNESANRLTSMPGFPLLYPDAGLVPQQSYAYEVMQDVKPAFWDGTKLNLPPVFNWGGRIGGTNALPSPPNQRYPGWLNINRTQDMAISLTKVAGRHTMKTGFYNNHSFKAQNVGAGGIANLTFQGYVDFGNNTNNALDTGFGFSNAATGVFNQYLQASKFVEGSMLYNNTEFYMQDNWKVNSRLTVDVGVRFTHQQPQYDQFQQMSNFFPNKWTASAAPVLYVPGCTGGAVTCANNALNAMDPRNNQILTATGAANTQAAIATPIPGTGNPLNGIVQAGNGISKYGYTWPKVVVGPRFGFAYDLSGTQSVVLRGGGGIFYDRPDGNTVFSIPGNPPIATAQDLRNGMLQTLGQGLVTQPIPAMVTFQYDAKVPASAQWQGGVQMALPWAAALDVSYVGNHGYNRLGNLQGGGTINLNAVDFGVAYQSQYQDPTKGTNPAAPGANALTTNLLRPYPGLSSIQENTTVFHDTYHSIQTNLNRRFRNGFSFGVNYVLSLSFKGNTGLTQRLQHAADGSVSIRADQADYEKLLQDLNLQRHLMKANFVWDLPKIPTSNTGMKVAGLIINDWQLSGLFTAGSGNRYDLGYSYNANGGSVNLTGSPDYGARVVFVGDPGKGCTSNQYNQFNIASVTGPTYNSVGLESGRNVLAGCPDHTLDLAIARNIRLGGGRQVQLRLDAFNALNSYVITGRSTTIQYNSPTDLTVRNPQFNADGSLVSTRLTPRNAGFGAANGAQNRTPDGGSGGNYNRTIQAQIRFQF